VKVYDCSPLNRRHVIHQLALIHINDCNHGPLSMWPHAFVNAHPHTVNTRIVLGWLHVSHIQHLQQQQRMPHHHTLKALAVSNDTGCAVDGASPVWLTCIASFSQHSILQKGPYFSSKNCPLCCALICSNLHTPHIPKTVSTPCCRWGSVGVLTVTLWDPQEDMKLKLDWNSYQTHILAPEKLLRNMNIVTAVMMFLGGIFAVRTLWLQRWLCPQQHSHSLCHEPCSWRNN